MEDSGNKKKELNLLEPLLTYNGKNTQEVTFFEIPIIIDNLKKIIKDDYKIISSTFLKYAAGVDIQIKHGILFVDTFIPHSGPYNRLLYIIDIHNEDSILYWIDSNGNGNYYGRKPLPENIAVNLVNRIQNDSQYKDALDRSILGNLLQYR